MTASPPPASTLRRPIRVLVVDDSAVVRDAMVRLLGQDPEISVIGSAGDPFAAAQKIAAEVPDVITLDIEMPRMDGLTFLRKIMAQRPIPVVICSTLVEGGSDTFAQALEAGAVEVFLKPRLDTRERLEEARTRLCDLVKAAAQARLGLRARRPEAPTAKLTADAVLPAARPLSYRTTEQIVVIGASTGGTEALRAVLETLPPDAPGIVIVQHMPERFTRQFADRLDGLCQITVREARDGDRVLRGQALIAPGNRHLLLARNGAQYRVEVRDGPLVRRHRPSVDVLFRSSTRAAGPNALGILLTGMGDDGAAGLAELRAAGAQTVAQSEESCVVYGMPKEAVRLGAAMEILHLDDIPRRILSFGSAV